MRLMYTQHGLYDHSAYKSWTDMILRCQNPKHRRFPHYGGRGIKVCERWLDFTNFVADMGERPSGYQIDRIDNDGDYEPSNCRWATPKENCRNRSTCKFITYRGETKTVIEWAEEMKLKTVTLRARLNAGWSVESALTKPAGRYSRKVRNKT